MTKKRKQRGDAVATEAPEKVTEGEAPAAAADSATPRKTSRRRGGDVMAEQEASAAVHAPCPADSEKETTDREGKKPRRNKQKKKKRDQTPCASASDADAAAMGISGDDCTDGDGVPGDAKASMSPRNGDDPNCPEVNIGEKGTAEMKKPKRRKKKKKNMQASAVSDDNALEVDKSRTDCKDVEDVPGDDKTVRNPRNEEDAGFSSLEIAEQEIQERKKKPRRRKRKNNNQDQSPSAVSDDALEVDKSRTDCKDVEDVPGDDKTVRNPRNEEDPGFSSLEIAEQEIQERKKKPRRRKRKNNNQDQSPSAVSDDNALEVDKSRTDCKDVEDVPGDDKTVRSPRNEEDRGLEIAEQEIQVTKKKPRRRKQKNNNQEKSPSAVADGDMVVVGNSGNDCTYPAVADVNMSSRNGEDQDCPEVHIAEKETPVRKKPELKKPKENKHERSPAAVSDDVALQPHKSGNVCVDEDDPSGDAQVSMGTRNLEDPNCPEVNIAEKGTHERKKPQDIVLYASAVVADESRNGCTDGDGAPQDIEPSICPRNDGDPDCPVVNNAEKGIQEMCKPKRKTRKKNSQEQSPSAVLVASDVVVDKSGHTSTNVGDPSGRADVTLSPRIGEDPEYTRLSTTDDLLEVNKVNKDYSHEVIKEGSSSVVLHASAVVADESINGCMDGDGAPQDMEPSICPRNDGDPGCPVVNNAEKGIQEMCKPKRKKRKNSQQQSPSAVLVASDVVVDKSGHASTNVGDPSGRADVTTSPRIGEGPEYPRLNATDDLLEVNNVNKGYSHKPMKNKHEQSPSAAPDTCAVVEDKSVKSYIDGKGLLGDTETSMSPRNGKDHDCSEVNIANELVEGKNGNNDNSQKPKNNRQKRKRRASVAVTETPRVDGFSSDERKDVCKTHSMKVTDKSVIISATSTSGENHKENIRNIYSPEGSLVRFQRKKLLILDLNGILADINTDRDVPYMADGRVRGKNVFKRNYLDDFLRFCFQNFELGIWSSRMKVNVDAVVDILMKDLRRHLVFCWDVSKCTTTNCFTLENNRKPLVLKELKKLWNKEDPNLPWEQGEYSPSNTLLVDDSPYKALHNPPNTAIFPQSYTYHNQEDNSLGPGGDLRVYLENIAAADDVQRYVQEHPFGQPSITESDPHWNFYAKIHYRLDSAGRKF